MIPKCTTEKTKLKRKSQSFPYPWVKEQQNAAGGLGSRKPLRGRSGEQKLERRSLQDHSEKKHFPRLYAGGKRRDMREPTQAQKGFKEKTGVVMRTELLPRVGLNFQFFMGNILMIEKSTTKYLAARAVVDVPVLHIALHQLPPCVIDHPTNPRDSPSRGGFCQ